jgi:hypothetical protein
MYTQNISFIIIQQSILRQAQDERTFKNPLALSLQMYGLQKSARPELKDGRN